MEGKRERERGWREYGWMDFYRDFDLKHHCGHWLNSLHEPVVLMSDAKSWSLNCRQLRREDGYKMGKKKDKLEFMKRNWDHENELGPMSVCTASNLDKAFVTELNKWLRHYRWWGRIQEKVEQLQAWVLLCANKVSQQTHDNVLELQMYVSDYHFGRLKTIRLQLYFHLLYLMQIALSNMVLLNQKHTGKWIWKTQFGLTVLAFYTPLSPWHTYISLKTHFKNKYINEVILLPNMIQRHCVQLKIY